MEQQKQQRTIILIDGQNLYHSLRNIGILEKDIAWGNFFNGLIGENDNLMAVYWFRPKAVKEIYLTKRKVLEQLIHENYNSRKEELLALYNKKRLPFNISKKVDGTYNKKLRWLKDRKQKFSQANYKYKKIESEYTEVEIIRSGLLRVDPYKGQILGEKGVDVAVAIHMVELALRDKCDKFILLSGDFDLYPAVRVASQNHKKIVLVELMDNNGKSSTSEDLKKTSNKVLTFKKNDFMTNGFINTKSNKHFDKKTNKDRFSDQIKKLITKDELEEALISLLKAIRNNGRDDESEKTVLLLQARLKQNQNSILRGVVLTSEANLEFARIRLGILDILGNI